MKLLRGLFFRSLLCYSVNSTKDKSKISLVRTLGLLVLLGCTILEYTSVIYPDNIANAAHFID